MRDIVIAVGLLLVAPGVAAAQTPAGSVATDQAAPAAATDEARAEARRYVAQAHIEQAVIARLVGVRAEIVEAMTRINHMSPEAAASFFDDDLLPTARTNAGEVAAAYAEGMAAAMSADEIRQLEAFLATPLGAKLISVQDALAGKMSAAQVSFEHKVLDVAMKKYQAEHPATPPPAAK